MRTISSMERRTSSIARARSPVAGKTKSTTWTASSTAPSGRHGFDILLSGNFFDAKMTVVNSACKQSIIDRAGEGRPVKEPRRHAQEVLSVQRQARPGRGNRRQRQRSSVVGWVGAATTAVILQVARSRARPNAAQLPGSVGLTAGMGVAASLRRRCRAGPTYG